MGFKDCGGLWRPSMDICKLCFVPSLEVEVVFKVVELA